MREVAERAGVSLTTVSHVINGTRFVSEDLVARVREAITELDYQPDRRARSLRRGRSETIAVIISDIGNMFFSDIVRGVEDRVLESGYDVLLCNTGEDPSVEERNVAMMIEQRVDGFVVAPTLEGDRTLEPLVRQAVPLVVVDRPVGLPVDQVFSDNERGGYMAARHLIELGHRRIGAIVELSGIRSFDDRIHGWETALTEAGLEAGDVRQAGLEIEGAAMAAKALLGANDRVTAVFSSNNLMTLGLLRHLRTAGLRYPDDVSLVGFDDPPWASSFHPGITSVAQRPFEMGYKAAEMLVERIEGSADAPKQLCLECELRVRESSAPLSC
jgi:LacI family transcriptional regulator